MTEQKIRENAHAKAGPCRQPVGSKEEPLLADRFIDILTILSALPSSPPPAGALLQRVEALRRQIILSEEILWTSVRAGFGGWVKGGHPHSRFGSRTRCEKTSVLHQLVESGGAEPCALRHLAGKLFAQDVPR